MRCDGVGVSFPSMCLLMGARTSNRKREDEGLSINRSHSYFKSPDSHVSKKPRISTMSSDRPVVSSNSTVARLSRYPEETTQLRREVHGPCRMFKFGLAKYRFWESKNSESSEQNEVGNILSYNYQIAKSRAIGALRSFGSLRSFPKDVIELDSDTPTERGASGDSKFDQDVEVIEDYKQEGRSMSMDQRPREVDTVQELDAKMMDVHQPSSSSVVVDLTNDNSKVENAEKMLGALSLDQDISSVSAYKKLLQSVEKRTSRLKSLDFEIELNEKRRSILQSQTPRKKPVDVCFLSSSVCHLRRDELRSFLFFCSFSHHFFTEVLKKHLKNSNNKFLTNFLTKFQRQ